MDEGFRDLLPDRRLNIKAFFHQIESSPMVTSIAKRRVMRIISSMNDLD
jgi:hypothetical protein